GFRPAAPRVRRGVRRRRRAPAETTAAARLRARVGPRRRSLARAGERGPCAGARPARRRRRRRQRGDRRRTQCAPCRARGDDPLARIARADAGAAHRSRGTARGGRADDERRLARARRGRRSGSRRPEGRDDRMPARELRARRRARTLPRRADRRQRVRPRGRRDRAVDRTGSRSLAVRVGASRRRRAASGRRAPGDRRRRGLRRRRRREPGALRHRGDRDGQARRARDRPRVVRARRPRRRRSRVRRSRRRRCRTRSPPPRTRRRTPARLRHRRGARRPARGDRDLLLPERRAGARAAAARRRARRRRRGAARPRYRAGARRGAALLLLRHLHLVRQLLPLLSRSRDPAPARRRLRSRRRLLQGLRDLRAGVPDRLDGDDRGGEMNDAGSRLVLERSGQSASSASGSPARERTMLLTGNHAVAWAAKLARPKFAPGYPITPQTPILEKLTEFQAAGEFDAEIITPESEHSVMAACIPASLAGVRVFTATASQGLLLMHEVLQYASGARAPIVVANVNRTVASPWAFWPDQTDSLAQRDTGWIQFYSESAQESLDSVIQAFRIAEAVLVPAMVSHDAFYVSHALEPVQVPAQELVDE